MTPPSNPLNARIGKTYHGPRYTPVAKLSECSHFDTRLLENYESSPRGRIDAEVCQDCGEVLRKNVIR